MARTFALVRPILPRVSQGNIMVPKAPKQYETHQNMSLGSNWVDRVRSLRKIPMRLHSKTCALILPFQPTLHRVWCSNETIQNAPKHYKTHQFMSLTSNGLDRVRSLRKTLMQFHGTNFFINCTSSIRSAPSFVQ